MKYLSISLVALLPAVLLCCYIYVKDRKEKEPIGLLVTLFVLGATLFVPVIKIENILIGVADTIMKSQMEFGVGGISGFTSTAAEIKHGLLCGFFATAFVEEVVIWSVLIMATSKNNNFNYLFDGIVYAVFLVLGFAAMENVFYAIRDGWGVFVLRSLTSVPAHMTFGVLMGFCYTMWHTNYIAQSLEQYYANEGIIKIERPCNCWGWFLGSIVLPVIVHGGYSFLRYFSSNIINIIFCVFVLVLYIACFIIVHNLSDSDNANESVAFDVLVRKYPALRARKNSLKH